MTMIRFPRSQSFDLGDELPLMKAEEAAAKLGLSVKTMMHHVRSGRLRFINVGTDKRKSYRFTPKNLRSFIENQKVREVPSCLSFQTKKASSKSTLSFGAYGFSEVPKPKTAGKPKP
ncbi:MAG: helix-turn-helix domain-containing protein [Tabrizicola sp.]